jgi:hypothetical protein
MEVTDALIGAKGAKECTLLQVGRIWRDGNTTAKEGGY